MSGLRVCINRARLLEDLHALRSFGAAAPYVKEARGGDGVPKGVIRPALTAQDIEARQWLLERGQQAGLKPRMDKLGTTLGRSSPSPGQMRLLMGSHSDTQAEGGWLDGALGVVFALEASRAIQEAGGPNAIDVVNFQDEEGRFGALTGSHQFCGIDANLQAISQVPEAAAPKVSLSDAITSRGLSDLPFLLLKDLIRDAEEDGSGYIGFLEAHIEQGRRLERSNQSVGVVSSIVGQRQYKIKFKGEQNHAGSTEMKDRRDAAAAAFKLAVALSDGLASAAQDARAPTAVWNIGQFELKPNAASIVPDNVCLTLQFRDPSEHVLDAMEDAMHVLVRSADGAGGVEVTAQLARMPVRAVAMAEDLRSHVQLAAEEIAPGNWQALHSGAVHDAGIVAQRMSSAMLFVPSLLGISHDFREDTNEDDITMGAQVFASAAASIIMHHQQGA